MFFTPFNSANATAPGGLQASVWHVPGQNASPYIPNGLSPVVNTTVSNIDFNWASGSVLGGPSEDVIVRFTGYITSPTTTSISFYAPGDDGVRLYIDGQLVINDWYDKGGGGSESISIPFTANISKQITLFYYENGGGANVWLYWSQPGGMQIVSPSAFTIEPFVPPPFLNVPTNLTATINNTGVALSWNAPQPSNASVERYAIGWETPQGGWAWSHDQTYITVDYGVLRASAGLDRNITFKIRADNDTLSTYSNWSNYVTIYVEDLERIALEQQQEEQRQSDANIAVTNYENQTLNTFQQIDLALTLKYAAQSAVNIVLNESVKTSLQNRVDIKTGLVNVAITLLEAQEAARAEAERQRIAAEQAALLAQLEAERVAAEEAARLEAERIAAAEAARIEAERQAAEAARIEAERIAAEEAQRLENERLAAEEEQRQRTEAERRAQEELARLESERIAAEEAARLEAERKAAEEAAKLESERKAAEEAAKLEAERKAAEEAEKKRLEEERIKAEREAAEEAERQRLAEEQAKILAELERQRLAEEEAKRLEEERKAAEEAARIEAEKRAAEEQARLEEERRAAEEAERKAEEERKAKEEAERARLEAEQNAKEDAEKLEEEKKDDISNVLEEINIDKTSETKLDSEDRSKISTAILQLSSEAKQELSKSFGISSSELDLVAETLKDNEILALAVVEFSERLEENGDAPMPYTLADVTTEVAMEKFLEDPLGALLAVDLEKVLDPSEWGKDMTDDQREKAQEVVIPVVIVSSIVSSVMSLRRL